MEMKSPHGNEPFDLILKQVKMKGAFSISPAFSAETVHSLREQPPSSWLSPSLGGSRAGSAGPGLQAPLNICAGGRPGGGAFPSLGFSFPSFFSIHSLQPVRSLQPLLGVFAYAPAPSFCVLGLCSPHGPQPPGDPSLFQSRTSLCDVQRCRFMSRLEAPGDPVALLYPLYKQWWWLGGRGRVVNSQGRGSSRKREQETGLSMAGVAFCRGRTILPTSHRLTCHTPGLQSPGSPQKVPAPLT